jgi:hypothetical protein
MNKFRDIIQRIKERKEIISLIMRKTEITPDNGFAYRYFLCKILGDRWEGEFMPSVRIANVGGFGYTAIKPIYQNERIIFQIDCLGKYIFISFKTEEFIKLLLYSDGVNLWKFRGILTKYALDLYYELMSGNYSKSLLRKKDFLFNVDFFNSEEYRLRMINIIAKYTWIKSRKKKVLHQPHRM